VSTAGPSGKETSVNGTDARPGWELKLAPRALLAGCALSFLACCLAGARLSRSNPFAGFERFHRLIAPESLFYPTARQVRALGRDRLPPDKVAVIVGGNSIMYGFGQTSRGLWTKALQAELGDGYRVINLALPGAGPAEFGAAAAEVLARDHPKVLFLASVSSAGTPLEPDGNVYRYFFWDAYSRGLLLADAQREALVRELCKERKDDGAFTELQRQMRVDRFIYSRDLWTRLAYTRFGTVWSPALAGAVWGGHKQNFWAARRRCELPEGPVPFEARYPPALDAPSLEIVRGWSVAAPLFAGGGAPVPAGLRACFPEPCRRRALLVVLPDSPYYVEQLTPAERARYRDVLPVAVSGLEQAGFVALEAGRGYTVEDFFDRCHLSEEGGRRLAAEVAPAVRRLAKNLGYAE
jgi:lysophospholipase L1-like esterase